MSGDWETVPWRAVRPDPSPERARAVGTVTGAIMSTRLAGRPPKASGPETFAQRKGSGRVAGGLCSAFGAHFSGKIQRAGAISGPERAILNEKWSWKARTDKRQRKSAVFGGFVRRA